MNNSRDKRIRVTFFHDADYFYSVGGDTLEEVLAELHEFAQSDPFRHQGWYLYRPFEYDDDLTPEENDEVFMKMSVDSAIEGGTINERAVIIAHCRLLAKQRGREI